MLGEVTAALDLGQDAQQREQSPPVGDGQRLVLDQLQFDGVDDRVHQGVDGDVLVDHALGQFTVARQQRVGRAGHGLTHQCEDLHDLGVQGLVGRRDEGCIPFRF